MAFQSYPKLSLRAGTWCPVSITYRPQAISSCGCNHEWSSSLKLRAISAKGVAMIHWKPVFPAIGDEWVSPDEPAKKVNMQASTSNLIRLSINIRNYHLGNSFISPLRKNSINTGKVSHYYLPPSLLAFIY